MTDTLNKENIEGLLLIDKPRGCTSFSLIPYLRKRLSVKKIGHAGTLDPFATGVMVLLVGRRYTRLSNQFLECDKEYLATIYLGKSTDTYDCDGIVTAESPYIPSAAEVAQVINFFQGTIEQVPPMYSAKKQQGKKLYQWARQGIERPRPAALVNVETNLISYSYPYIVLRVNCSKGTYIRSIAHECGLKLNCGAYLVELQRTRSGGFHLDECLGMDDVRSPSFNLIDRLIALPMPADRP